MAKLKGLGRGLDALLSGSEEAAGGENLQAIAIERLRTGKYQPRTRMDDASLAMLAESIKAQGVVQPILVRPVGGGYQLPEHLRITIGTAQENERLLSALAASLKE